MKNNIAIIDGDSIIYLSVYNKEGQQKTISQIFTCIDSYINNILNKTDSKYFTGFLTDGSFRYKIGTQKEYKANRKAPKPKYFNLAKAYLLDEYNFITMKNYEADDLCIMAANTYNTTGEYNPIIATPDKDLKQIAGNFYDYKKGEFITLEGQNAFKNLWKQVLTGDSGDNIPGIQGIGPAKAEKILENSTDYRTTVLSEYIKVYGEYNGIIYFSDNYQLVKMLNNLDGDLYYPEVHYLEPNKEEDEWF